MGAARGWADPGAAALSEIAYDPGALEAFYRQHVALVTRFVARRVADPHVVADLTAEVFVAVIDSAHTYRPGRGPQTAWLYGSRATSSRRSPAAMPVSGEWSAGSLAAGLLTKMTSPVLRNGSTPRALAGPHIRRWQGSPKPSVRCSNSSPLTAWR